MLGVLGWVGIVAGGDGVAVAEAAVASLDVHLSPAGVADDVLGVSLERRQQLVAARK